MYTLLLAVIYIAFISLGLPDSLLGAGWPAMNIDLGVPISYAGIITMIISGGTIVSSLMSDKTTAKFGTGVVTFVSVLLTAAAMFGFSVSKSFALLCLWAIPYGLGAGAIDAALNNYVALNYSSKHMSWLHCFWGVGTIISPYIMSYALTANLTWHGGYRIVAVIQFIITAFMLLCLPLWKSTASDDDTERKPCSLSDIFKINGVLKMLIGFFAYCAAEATVMLWASSYMVRVHGINEQQAAAYASLFFIGITFGRFVSGFISNRLGDAKLIRTGAIITILGAIFISMPLKYCTIAGFITAGMGCAPIYPSIIHSTPFNFGKENSQAVIGVQMASAYVGSTFMPPIFGLIANHISIRLLPVYILIFMALLLIMTESLNKTVQKRNGEV